MLSQTAAYALRAVIHLAGAEDDGPVRVEDIADALDVPRNYLSKILHVLAREEVLVSTRGPGGGFMLLGPPEGIRLADVVGEFDPLDEVSGCLLGRAQCDDIDPCPAHLWWKHLAVELSDFFENTTVADLATLQRENGSTESIPPQVGASKPPAAVPHHPESSHTAPGSRP